jgi:hypothetical protein
VVVVNLFVGNDVADFHSHDQRVYADGRIVGVVDLAHVVDRHGRLRLRKRMIPIDSYFAAFVAERWRVLRAQLEMGEKASELMWHVFLPPGHPDRDARLESYWAKTLSALLQIRDFCDQHGCRLIVTFLPQETQVSRHYWRKYPFDFPLDEEAFAATRPQRRLRDFCWTNAISCVDLLPAFRSHPKRDQLYFQNLDPHLSAHGHLAVAQVLHPELRSALDARPPSANRHRQGRDP